MEGQGAATATVHDPVAKTTTFKITSFMIDDGVVAQLSDMREIIPTTAVQTVTVMKRRVTIVFRTPNTTDDYIVNGTTNDNLDYTWDASDSDSDEFDSDEFDSDPDSDME
jgi:uncharacterized protein YrrD